MSAAYAGIELGGSWIRCRVIEAGGTVLAEQRFATASPAEALTALAACIGTARGARPLAAVGVASFGPLALDPAAANFGRLLATPKPGWSGFDLRGALAGALQAPVHLDTDVNAAALAEQALGAGQGVTSLAYVTVGTGIGAGLALAGRALRGAAHPEAGHLLLRRRPEDRAPSSCPFHADCAEGLASGPALALRLPAGVTLGEEPRAFALEAAYLGELLAGLVLTWAPERIVLGGGVLGTAGLREAAGAAMRGALADYGPPQAARDGYLVAPALADSGLEGALLLARGEA